MRMSLEWILELVTAVILCMAVFVGVNTKRFPDDVYLAEGRSEEGGRDAPEGNEEEKEPFPEKYQIRDFEVVLQMPELPTGCEITALTMVLNYYGYDVDKVTMAEKYLPTAPAEFYNGGDGELYGTDLNRYFLGDPATEEGYICGAPAIRSAADKYLRESGSARRASDKTGASAEEIYRLVSEDTPVVVWVTINMEERRDAEGWKTEEGEYVDWANNDHGAVLIGYSEDTVTIADPIAGEMVYSREMFEEVYASRGKQCVCLVDYRI